jgi:hypothetical protein
MLKEQYERSIETAKLIANETRTLNLTNMNQTQQQSQLKQDMPRNEYNRGGDSYRLNQKQPMNDDSVFTNMNNNNGSTQHYNNN